MAPDNLVENQPLPCPFCGSIDIDARFSLGGDGRLGCGCMTCGACAGDGENEVESVAKWNTRCSSICGIVSASGPNLEPLACGFPDGHSGQHSWGTLPTFAQLQDLVQRTSWQMAGGRYDQAQNHLTKLLELLKGEAQ